MGGKEYVNRVLIGTSKQRFACDASKQASTITPCIRSEAGWGVAITTAAAVISVGFLSFPLQWRGCRDRSLTAAVAFRCCFRYAMAACRRERTLWLLVVPVMRTNKAFGKEGRQQP